MHKHLPLYRLKIFPGYYIRLRSNKARNVRRALPVVPFVGEMTSTKSERNHSVRVIQTHLRRIRSKNYSLSLFQTDKI